MMALVYSDGQNAFRRAAHLILCTVCHFISAFHVETEALMRSANAIVDEGSMTYNNAAGECLFDSRHNVFEQ